MGINCSCCHNDDIDSNYVVVRHKVSSNTQVNMVSSKSQNISIDEVKKNKNMKEIDSLEPIHHSDFEIVPTGIEITTTTEANKM